MATTTGTLSSAGIGSGLNVSSLVSQLMAVESQPLQNFAAKIAGDQAKISAWGSLKSTLSSLKDAANSLKDPSKLTPLKASLGDTTIGTATASSLAVPGSYTINVGTLGSAHKIISGTFASTTAPLTTVGNTLTVNVGSKSAKINITNSNNTLGDIRAAINNAQIGASATIINAADGTHQLIITADKAGSANQISLSGVPELSFTEVDPAKDATVTIDNVAVTASGNDVTSGLDGITLNLAKTGSTTLTVSRDKDATQNAVNAFVKAYNAFHTNIDSATNYDQSSKKASALNSDSLARSIQNNLRSALGNRLTGTTGTYSLLGEIGVSIDKDGVMSVDSSKLQKAVDKDTGSVNSVLAGYGDKLSKAIDGLITVGGSIDNRTSGINRAVTSITKQRDAFQNQLDAIQARYTKQFSSLDTIVSQAQSTLTFLNQQLAKL